MPLLEALDPDTGIVFDGEDSAPAPLLADLRAGDARARDATWGKREEHLLSRLLDLQAAGEEELVLEERDLGVLERPDAPPCPDAFGAMAVLAARSDAALASGRFRVFVLGADGPSGARLLGRFCHADARSAGGRRGAPARRGGPRPGRRLRRDRPPAAGTGCECRRAARSPQIRDRVPRPPGRAAREPAAARRPPDLDWTANSSSCSPSASDGASCRG